MRKSHNDELIGLTVNYYGGYLETLTKPGTEHELNTFLLTPVFEHTFFQNNCYKSFHKLKLRALMKDVDP